MRAIEDFKKIREVVSSQIKDLSLNQLIQIPTNFNNHIWWNIAHLVVTQQILHYQLSGLEKNVSPTEVKKYRKGTSPKDQSEEITPQEIISIKNKLITQADLLKEDYHSGKFKQFNPYSTSSGFNLNTVDEAIIFNNFHEGIHLGTILALKKIIH